MSYQFATAPTSSNPYIAHIVNNIDLIMILNKEKKDWMKKYHKIIQGLETIADIKTTLLQASKDYKIDGDIYNISEEL